MVITKWEFHLDIKRNAILNILLHVDAKVRYFVSFVRTIEIEILFIIKTLLKIYRWKIIRSRAHWYDCHPIRHRASTHGRFKIKYFSFFFWRSRYNTATLTGTLVEHVPANQKRSKTPGYIHNYDLRSSQQNKLPQNCQKREKESNSEFLLL